MATEMPRSHSADATVLDKLLRPNDNDLPADQAKALLNIRFGRRELAHNHELLTRDQDDTLTLAEKARRTLGNCSIPW
jgi:hypothetical protein